MTKFRILWLCSWALLYGCNSVQREEVTNEKNHEPLNWKSEVESISKRFGHRNWIVIADAAYPEQSHPAINTMTIDASQLEAIEYVNNLVEKSEHVTANIFLDEELTYLSDEIADGIDDYRIQVNQIIKNRPVSRLLHEEIIKEIDKSAELYKILILKTNLTIPYTSVFFQLECGYWDAESERILREQISQANE